MALFIIFDEKEAGAGYCQGFTSMKGVSDFTKIPLGTLSNHFTRDRKRWHFYEDKGIKVIRVDSVMKGNQRVHKKGVAHDRNI